MAVFAQANTKAELEQIHNLAQSIWQEHYSNILTDGQIQYMVSNFQSTEAMEAQLKEGYQYFQILDDSSEVGKTRLVGYFSFIFKDDAKDCEKIPSIFLSKLYIQKTSRNKGIAKSIIAYLKRVAKKNALEGIWLTVNKQNENSIIAYKKLGFKTYREDSVDIGRGYVMDDYYMKTKVE